MQPLWLLLLFPVSLSSFIHDDGEFDDLPDDFIHSPTEQIHDFLEQVKTEGASQCFSKKRKSPINIEIGIVKLASFSPLVFKDYSSSEKVSANAKSNYSASIHGFANWTRQPIVSGGPMNGEYHLMEIQWDMMDLSSKSLPYYSMHYGHTVNKAEHDFELHFVHTKGGLSIKEAQLLPDGILIVAVFINEREATSFEKQQHTENRKFDLSESGVQFIWISPDNFLPDQRNTYFTYTGTFMHPPCTGDVTWIILADPIFKSRYDLNDFRLVTKMNPRSFVYHNMNKRVAEVLFHANNNLSVPSSSVSISLGVIAGFILGLAVGLLTFYMRKKFIKNSVEEKQDHPLVNYQIGFDNVNVS